MQCVTTCCGLSMSCTEPTTKEANHKFLYGVNAIYLIFSIVILATSLEAQGYSELIVLFPKIYGYATAEIVFSVLLAAFAALGIWGTNRRNKVAIMWYWTFMVGITIGQIVGSSYAMNYCAPESFDLYYEGEFSKHWKELAETAETDATVKQWFIDTQTAGDCCGWVDDENEEENPSWLSCEGKSDVCSNYFRDDMCSHFGSFETVALVLASFDMAFVFMTFVLICRLKEFYQAETVDYGDFIKVPFNKVRNIDDLLSR